MFTRFSEIFAALVGRFYPEKCTAASSKRSDIYQSTQLPEVLRPSHDLSVFRSLW